MVFLLCSDFISKLSSVLSHYHLSEKGSWVQEGCARPVSASLCPSALHTLVLMSSRGSSCSPNSSLRAVLRVTTAAGLALALCSLSGN